ncbi:MAG TPA: FprA family A-type flavoprotein [Bacteroidales bacterium]|nr:FprA family A-type flavoprotein [Bacteroidales bacterium]HPT01013.1 FprA family A-type flavoprotein [Bacteroidales bacterium]
MADNKVLKISDDVSWVGVLDRELVTFDVVMHTPYGTTYNAYFINADRKTIVETVKVKYFDTFVEKLRTLCDPAELEYIIVNHTEPDHSGSLGKLLEIAPKAKVVGSGNAIRYLRDLLGFDFTHIQVKDQDVIDLGNKKLRIIGAPNLHWPDSVYSYLEEDKLLFTCDSFGAHYCDEAMFDDLAGNWDDSFKYYFDVILKPFSRFMLKAIEKIRPLEINAILPGHGPILRSHWKKYVDMSEKLSRETLGQGTKPMVFIAYVSAYQNSATIGAKIAEGAKQVAGVDVELHDIETMGLDKIDAYLSECTGLIVGSPTINQNILMPVYQLFAAVNPIRDKGKLAGAFGSYGWSGESMKMIESNLTNLKLKFFGEGVFVKFTPHEEDYRKAVDYGRKFAEQMLAGLSVTD